MFFTILLIIFLLIVVVSNYCFIVTVESNSMEPTLYNDDRVLVIRYLHRRGIRKGDIVVLNPWIKVKVKNVQEHTLYIKRVTALEGETVITSLKELNSEVRFREAQFHTREGKRYWFIPKGFCFVRGDHPVGGYDSMSWGPIHTDKILGRVICHLFKSQDKNQDSRACRPASLLEINDIVPSFLSITLSGNIITEKVYYGNTTYLFLLDIKDKSLQYCLKYCNDLYKNNNKSSIQLFIVIYDNYYHIFDMLKAYDIPLDHVIYAPLEYSEWIKMYKTDSSPCFYIINKECKIISITSIHDYIL